MDTQGAAKYHCLNCGKYFDDLTKTLFEEPTCSKHFNGNIGEVRIYNRALSAEEIKALYEQGVAPRPKLAIEMDIDTSLKQGEVRKGTIRVENIGNSDAKSVEVRLFSEGLGIDVEKSYAKIPTGRLVSSYLK